MLRRCEINIILLGILSSIQFSSFVASVTKEIQSLRDKRNINRLLLYILVQRKLRFFFRIIFNGRIVLSARIGAWGRFMHIFV